MGAKRKLRGSKAIEGYLDRDSFRFHGMNYVATFRIPLFDRILLVKRGVPLNLLDQLARDMSIPVKQLAGTLGFSSSTISRKIRSKRPLSTSESSRVIGMVSLIGQIQTMVCESGNAAGFDAAAWVARWIYRPLPALGGQRPAEFLDTYEGQGFVSCIVARMQSGAYS